MARKYLRQATTGVWIASLDDGPLLDRLREHHFNCHPSAAPIWVIYEGQFDASAETLDWDSVLLLQAATRKERETMEGLFGRLCRHDLHNWHAATVEHLRQCILSLAWRSSISPRPVVLCALPMAERSP